MDGMMEKGGTEPAVSERPQEAGGDKSAGGSPPQRFSAKRIEDWATSDRIYINWNNPDA